MKEKVQVCPQCNDRAEKIAEAFVKDQEIEEVLCKIHWRVLYLHARILMPEGNVLRKFFNL